MFVFDFLKILQKEVEQIGSPLFRSGKDDFRVQLLTKKYEFIGKSMNREIP